MIANLLTESAEPVPSADSGRIDIRFEPGFCFVLVDKPL